VTTPLVDLVQEQPAEVRRQHAAVRGLAVLSVLLLLFGLVGLVTIDSDDGGAPAGTPLAVVFGAADKTLGQSARITMKTETNFGGQTGPVMTADGVSDFASKEMALTMKVAGLFELEMRSDGETIFVKVPQEMMEAPKPWIAVDLSDAEAAAAKDNPMAGLPGASGPMGASDPGEMLQWLKSHEAVKDAAAVGQATVQGTSTTQYRVTVDLAALAKAVDAPPEALEGGPTEFIIDLYVDGDGLIRREVVRIGGDPQTGGAFAFSAVATIDFSDFGLDVDVDPPPADQVYRAKSVEEFEQIFEGGR
jgi:hypothetical protein